MTFEWDEQKEKENIQKHSISFHLAQFAFADPKRVIAEDLEHSVAEKRFYCFGEVAGRVVTVRFTYRGDKVRIFGAGYWRKGKVIYDKGNRLLG